MTDMLGSLEETAGCPNRENDRGLDNDRGLPERVGRRLRSRRHWPRSVPRGAFTHLVAVRLKAEECWPQGQPTFDSTPIGRAYVSAALRLNKPERSSRW